jgi:hypothetical protein
VKNKFTADGELRFEQGVETALRQEIQKKYADELAAAPLFKKLRIKFQMRQEFLRRKEEGHKPSAKTLW